MGPKTVLGLVLAIAIGCAGHKVAEAPAPPVTAPAATNTPAPEALLADPAPASASPTRTTKGSVDAFATTIKPLLARTCTPCHTPGGKMYDRLPFDDPATLLSKKEGVLRRLKGEDKETVEAWFASQGGER